MLANAEVAEATESRLRRQAEQEETARKRAEEAQQRAKKRHFVGRRVGLIGCFWGHLTMPITPMKTNMDTQNSHI